jgi:cytochrome c peroxidase
MRTLTTARIAALVAALISLICADAFCLEQGSRPTEAARSLQSTSAIAELGLRLFTDTRLSATRNVSCATCHVPELAFSDGLPVAIGINEQPGTRNTPSLWDVSTLTTQFWDGRRATLEEQALDPVFNAREHGLATEDELLSIVRSDPVYTKAFQTTMQVEPGQIESRHVAAALASFERTLQSQPSRFDRFRYDGERSALTAAEIRGLRLFEGRAGCTKCHLIEARQATLSDQQFHSIGVGMQEILPHLAAITQQVAATDRRALEKLIAEDTRIAALGRFIVTKDPRDIGKFRTPSLRNVAITAPYMHDGSIVTLEAAIDFEVYYRSLQNDHPLILTPSEKSDISAFLHSLTSPNAQSFSVDRPDQ